MDINREGVVALEEALAKVPTLESGAHLEAGSLIIDTRPQEHFKQSHIEGAINLMDGGKFETWLGSIVAPDEEFYLVAQNREALQQVIRKASKIGYERLIKGAVVDPSGLQSSTPLVDVEEFRNNPQHYTVVDIRNANEYAGGALFNNAINIPLPELRERVSEIPQDKPIMVHCAGGYRSAAGASIVAAEVNNQVFDLSEAVNDFK